MSQFVLISIVICLSVRTESVLGEHTVPSLVVADEESEFKFPNDFLLGSATSAFQTEGGWNEDGRTPSIWDDFVHEHPEMIENGDNHDISSYSYRYYDDDIKALKELGATAYRFSISWSRVLPTGEISDINEAGIAYYNNLIDKLVQNGIQPIVTLSHYDLPTAIQRFGGYMNYVFVKYFEAYAKLMFEKFGDRVKYWITFNEPYHSCTEGCGRGHRAPLIKAEGIGEYMCMHNKLKAHALAYHVYRKHFYEKQKGKIGIAISARFAYSATNDTAAVDRALQFQIGWTAHAIFTKEGDYPKVMREQIDMNSLKEGRPFSRLPTLSPHWVNKLRGSADFLALNYYTSRYVVLKDEPTGPNPSWERDAMFREVIPKEWKKGRTPWLYSVPQGLRDFLKWIRVEYNDVEVLIAENGWSDEGEMEDHDRIEYLRDHMAEVLKVLKNKESNLSGYLAWALVDNFEWAGGYAQRFGLYAVNFTSPRRERTPKLSAKFVKQVYESRQLPPL